MWSETVKFLEKKHTLILPFLLTAVLGVSLYSIYSVNVLSLWTAGVVFVTLAVFALCEFINKHHLIGGVIFTLLLFFDLRIFFSLVFGNDWGESFQRWFLTGAEQVTTRTEHLLALLISLVPFFGVVVYYFTNILYRMSFLTLASLIPCAVSVKVLSEIDNVYVCLIALLNVAVLMQEVRSRRLKNSREIGQTASVFSACVFSLGLLIISSAVPKETDARYYDRFEELFMDSNFTVELDENFSLFSDISGNADSYRNFSNRRMYTLYGENVPYFKRQTFDYYDFELDAWTADKYFSDPVYTAGEWVQMRGELSLTDLRSAILKAEEYEPGFVNKYGFGKLRDYEGFNDEEKQIFVQCEDFGALYFLSPARVMSIEPYDLSGNTPDRYVTRGGVIRTIRNMHPKNLGYTVNYRDEFMSRFLWLELGGADMSAADSALMLTELYDILSEKSDPLADTADGFLSQEREAEYYNELTRENTSHVPETIAALAGQVTAGCVYDWEKANALQNYFINDGFVYDLRYVAADSSPEYFLFESRRGSCSDFASAFTLMARSVGLTVRYAEGYSPDITSREGIFTISDSCSHAYPEVFVQNLGWIVFEPTVPSDYNGVAAGNAIGGDIRVDYRLVFVMCVIAGIVLVIGLGIILIYPAVSDSYYIRKALTEPPGRCAVLIYKRMISRTAAKMIRHGECLTPFEAAGVIGELTGCDITLLTNAVEISAYGSCEPDTDKTEFADIFRKTKSAVKVYMRDKNKADRQRAKRGKKQELAAEKSEDQQSKESPTNERKAKV